ncbi:MAG TPA: DUF3224 domain-containing protein, partial [Thermoanaerobaculia bacterium]
MSVALAVVLVAGVAAEEKRVAMKERASGTFEVKVAPIAQEGRFPRLSLDKTFSGDLVGTSAGEMMSVDGTVKGSGAYVAVERVTGTLQGRKGSFSLIHNGTMRKGGDFRLEIKIVPDSGTEQLKGITGTMQIVIEGGKHLYHFDYTIEPES